MGKKIRNRCAGVPQEREREIEMESEGEIDSERERDGERGRRVEVRENPRHAEL